MKKLLLILALLPALLNAQPVPEDNTTRSLTGNLTGGRTQIFQNINPAPALPTGLTATAVVDQINLDWSDNSDADLAGYVLYRSTDNIDFAPHTTGFGGAANVVTDVPLVNSQFNDTSTVAGTTYYYRVLAVDASGKKSSFSAVASATAITSPDTPVDTTAPPVPDILTAAPGDTTVSLSWTESAATDIDFYSVHRDTTSPLTTADDITHISGTSYVDTGLTNATTYYYAISATDLSGNESALSDEVSATPTAPDSTTTEGTEYFYYRFEANAVNYASPADYRWGIWNIAGYAANDNTGTDLFSTDQASVSASSAPNEDQNAFNGDSSSGGVYWDSFPQAGTTWIQVRLNNAAVIRSIDYYSRFGSSFGWTPQSMNIYGSNNGTNFTLLDTVNLANVATLQQFVDIQAAGGGTGPGTGGGDGGTGVVGPENFDMTMAEIGYRSVSMSWEDIGGDWDDPVIIQRSTTNVWNAPTDLTNNQAPDNTGATTFRFLGLGATNYTDIEDLAEGTNYYFRVAKVTNLKAHYDSGATPTFSTWKYGNAITGTLASSRKQTYNVTQAPYNADDTGATNAYDAIKDAWDDAIAAGGGIVYLPTGTYKIYPTDADIQDEGGLPTQNPGDTRSSALFHITSDNMTFLGDGSGSTVINLRLWNDNPATEWLQVKNSSGTVTAAKRYFMFMSHDVVNFTLKDMTINGGATPVTQDKSPDVPSLLEASKNQWDQSHKLVASFDLTRIKNIVVDGIVTSDWRGEVFYTGGISGKYFIKDTTITRTNSSAISMSADGEYVNVTVKEAANAAVESATFTQVPDFRTGRLFNQNTIARGCTFDCWDQDGTMKDLPGYKSVPDGFGFNGWLVFNQTGTYQTVTDTHFEDTGQSGYAPWSETHNALLFNFTVENSAAVPIAAFIDWRPAGKSLYNLEGGLLNNLVLGGSFDVAKNYTDGNTNPIIINYSSGLDEINRVVSSLDFVNNSGTNYTIDSLFLDRNNPGIRTGFLFQDMTTSGTNSITLKKRYNGGSGVEPTYDNVFGFTTP